MNNDNSNEIVAGTDGESHNSVACYGCGFKGHYRNQCLYDSRNGIISNHNSYSFTQENDLFFIQDTWLLIDTCSTCKVIKNSELISNIRECTHNKKLTAYTNIGAQHYTQMADLKTVSHYSIFQEQLHGKYH